VPFAATVLGGGARAPWQGLGPQDHRHRRVLLPRTGALVGNLAALPGGERRFHPTVRVVPRGAGRRPAPARPAAGDAPRRRRRWPAPARAQGGRQRGRRRRGRRRPGRPQGRCRAATGGQAPRRGLRWPAGIPVLPDGHQPHAAAACGRLAGGAHAAAIRGPVHGRRGRQQGGSHRVLRGAQRQGGSGGPGRDAATQPARRHAAAESASGDQPQPGAARGSRTRKAGHGVAVAALRQGQPGGRAAAAGHPPRRQRQGLRRPVTGPCVL
jgi:hypothetical protein